MDILKIRNEVSFAESQFKLFENKITDILILVDWLENHKNLYKSVKYKTLEYPFISSFVSVYTSVVDIKNLISCSSIAKKAIIEFNKIDKSKKSEIKDWLHEYKENELLISFGYEETPNCEQTKLILFKNSPDIFNENHTIFDNVIIDITNYESSIRFRKLYGQHSYVLKELEIIK